ncbi:UNVERIFIED_CONTAM: hypothetical protein RKD50_000043 [Streptomyces canus]
MKSAVHLRMCGLDLTITCTSDVRHGTSPRVRNRMPPQRSASAARKVHLRVCGDSDSRLSFKVSGLGALCVRADWTLIWRRAARPTAVHRCVCRVGRQEPDVMLSTNGASPLVRAVWDRRTGRRRGLWCISACAERRLRRDGDGLARRHISACAEWNSTRRPRGRRCTVHLCVCGAEYFVLFLINPRGGTSLRVRSGLRIGERGLGRQRYISASRSGQLRRAARLGDDRYISASAKWFATCDCCGVSAVSGGCSGRSVSGPSCPTRVRGTRQASGVHSRAWLRPGSGSR